MPRQPLSHRDRPSRAGELVGRKGVAGQSESPYELAGAFHCVRWDYFIMQESSSRTVRGLTPEALRGHIEYNAWASSRLVDAAAALSTADLTRDFQTADHSVLGTLAHIYAADRVWLSRLAGAPFPGFVTEADRNLRALQDDWPALHHR